LRQTRDNPGPVTRHDRPKVEYLAINAFRLRLSSSFQHDLHAVSITYKGHISTGAANCDLPKRASVTRLSHCHALAQDMLLQEHYGRIITVDRVPEQTGRILRRTGGGHADARSVRKQPFVALAMPQRFSGKIGSIV